MYHSRRVGESTFHGEFVGDSSSKTEEYSNIPHQQTVMEEHNQPSDNQNITIQEEDVPNSDFSNVPIPRFERI